MEFESINNIYRAIHLISGNEDYDTYFCSANNDEYILLCLKSAKIKIEKFGQFMEMTERDNYNEIAGTFTDRNNICIVFENDETGKNLKTIAADEGIKVQEKLDAVYKIIEGMCIRNIPSQLICDMLLSGNVGIKADGTAGFFYNLRHISDYDSFDMKKLCKLLSDEILLLFEYELSDSKCGEIKEFAETIRKKDITQYIELFELYKGVYEKVSQKIKSGAYEYESFGLKLWKGLKKLVPILKKLLVVVLLVLAIILILSSLFKKQENNGGNIQYIGKVSIEEYKDGK